MHLYPELDDHVYTQLNSMVLILLAMHACLYVLLLHVCELHTHHKGSPLASAASLGCDTCINIGLMLISTCLAGDGPSRRVLL